MSGLHLQMNTLRLWAQVWKGPNWDTGLCVRVGAQMQTKQLTPTSELGVGKWLEG